MQKKYKMTIPLTEALLLSQFGIIFQIGIAWSFSEIPTGTGYDSLINMIGMLLSMIVSILSLGVGQFGLMNHLTLKRENEAII